MGIAMCTDTGLHAPAAQADQITHTSTDKYLCLWDQLHTHLRPYGQIYMLRRLMQLRQHRHRHRYGPMSSPVALRVLLQVLWTYGLIYGRSYGISYGHSLLWTTGIWTKCDSENTFFCPWILLPIFRKNPLFVPEGLRVPNISTKSPKKHQIPDYGNPTSLTSWATMFIFGMSRLPRCFFKYPRN